MDQQRAGHSRLHDEPLLAQIEDRVLGPPEEIPNPSAGQVPLQPMLAHPPQHVAMAQHGAYKPPPHYLGAEITDDGLDFGKLGQMD